MGQELDLLRSLPRTARDVEERETEKNAAVVHIAKKFDRDYFDGDRKYGYGGYHYDGRWRPVAHDIIEHYELHWNRSCRVLDVGCAKGFLVKDLRDGFPNGLSIEVFGIDVSRYAVTNCHPDVVGRLHLGSADDLPFSDDSFDLVVSINTLHNLPRLRCKRALQEIVRVSRGPAFVQVDSYHTPEQRDRFEDWVLTAEYHGYPREWLDLFKEAGYDGDYAFTVV
jgi:ubiquinone/menaquinone biosynthesis C-methylase UbiE